MQYQKNVFLLLVLVAVGSVSISSTVAYFQSKQLVLEEIKTQARSLAASAATSISGDLHTTIKTRNDEQTEAYRTLVLQLRRIRDANRRPDLYIRHIYTFRTSATNPAAVEFVVDAEEKPEDFSHVGDPLKYQGMEDEQGLPDLEHLQADEDFTRDQWGEWLSAAAPILDSQGKVVGAVGVDLQASDVRGKTRRVLTGIAKAFGWAILAGVLLSGLLASLLRRHSRRQHITVLFADMRGFTAMSEQMAPEDVVRFLNEYFDRMSRIVVRHQGTLDKFMGDGLMAIFGAPRHDPYQEENALRAALEMRDELSRMSVELNAIGKSTVRVGIGINSGNAVVGNIGSKKKNDYTAIGDTVNIASRLEAATRDFDTDILISEATYEAVKPITNATRMEVPLQLKGRARPVVAYKVEGLRS